MTATFASVERSFMLDRHPQLRPVEALTLPDAELEARVGWRSVRYVCPHLTPREAREVAFGLGVAFARFGIDTPRRAAAAIALLADVSDGFRDASSPGDGAQLEGRRDLGNTRPGDGESYRPRGRVAVVGRTEYRRLSQAVGCNFVRCPELLDRSPWAELAGAWWWQRNGCNDLADRGDLGGIVQLLDPELTGSGVRWRYHRRARRVARWLVPRAAPGGGALLD